MSVMSRTSRIAIIIIPLALIALWPRVVRTETGIQLCEEADGSSIYTDKACAVFDAKAVPMKGELLTRIDTADDVSVSTISTGGYRDASEPLQRSRVSARRSFSGGCARSPEQLAMDLQGAFALGDVNRVAESYHWTGMTHRQATPVMQQLARLAAQPLLEAQFLNAQIGPGHLQVADLDQGAGMMQLVFSGDGHRSINADVQRYAGCYFIRF